MTTVALSALHIYRPYCTTTTYLLLLLLPHVCYVHYSNIYDTCMVANKNSKFQDRETKRRDKIPSLRPRDVRTQVVH